MHRRLRICYTLGPTGTARSPAFLRGPRVPTVLGFDPLFQFMHEDDVVDRDRAALEKKVRGVFNVAGPPRCRSRCSFGRRGDPVPMPEFVFQRMLGRLGLPKLPPGALSHIKYPVVVDGSAFRKATGFVHEVDEVAAMQGFRDAFPVDT